MIEYTWCPAGCGSRVVIQAGDRIPTCCLPCFQGWWAAMFSEDDDPVQAFDHSQECRHRQSGREGLPVVTDREFTLAGRVPDAQENPQV